MQDQRRELIHRWMWTVNHDSDLAIQVRGDEEVERLWAAERKLQAQDDKPTADDLQLAHTKLITRVETLTHAFIKGRDDDYVRETYKELCASLGPSGDEDDCSEFAFAEFLHQEVCCLFFASSKYC